MERIVHICTGESTADLLSLADLPGDIRVWSDALTAGPLLPVGDAEYYAARGDYWAARGHGDAKGNAERVAGFDRAVDEALAAEEVILWIEHALFDQLALVRMLSRVARRGAPAQLTIVSIDRHPDVPSYTGLAQLGPDQLAALWPTRVPIARDAFEEAVAAWIAVTAPDPRALPFVFRRVKALPFLAGALERHLEELPDPSSGMSRTERQLLAAVARGTAGRALATELHAIDPRYPISDVALLHALAGLGGASFVEPAAAPSTLAAATPKITALGRQALAGAIDRVHEIGIDTWRGGVHLTGRGPVWRWDGRERKLFER